MLYKLVTNLTRTQKGAILLLIDVFLISVSYGLAALLLSGPTNLMPPVSTILTDLTVVIFVGAALTVLMGLNHIKLNAYQMQGVVETAFVSLVMSLAGAVSALLLTSYSTPPHIFVVFGMLFLILSVTSRLLMRQWLLKIYITGQARTRLLIYGAGQTGQQLATALATDNSVMPVAFVDDDPRLQSLTIAGLKVNSPLDIPLLVKSHHVERIVLAMPSVQPSVQARIIRQMPDVGCEVHALPSFADLVANKAKRLSDTRPVDLNEILGRKGLADDLPGVSETYRNRCILVTGAGGSIGSELCRQIVAAAPSCMVLMDHSEWALFQIDRELREMAPELDIKPVLGSVCQRDLVAGVMAKYKVEIVLHAAAYKHVPLVEYNALEGMRNNVIGTKIVADAARDAGVERFILVSTDKAVRPANIMGASKRFAEQLVQDLATRSTTTRFSMVRFGNVLGSSGSVIPLFEEQIARGGPVTLTHNDITRYFMTIPEAVQLVLLAGSFARGGDVFVLDMGKPISIKQVARQMIEGAGHTVRDQATPNGDIEIEVTGLRPGEKLHEELLIGSDMLTTPHPKIMRAQEDHLSEIEMANVLSSLRQAIEVRDIEMLNTVLSKWIERADETAPVIVNE